MNGSADARASVFSGRAYALVWTGLALGVFAVALAAVAVGGALAESWPALAILAVGALAVELFPFGQRVSTHQLALVFVVASVFLLPPVGVALVVLAAQAPDLARRESLDGRFSRAVGLGALLVWLFAAISARLAFTLLGGAVADGALLGAPLAVFVALAILMLSIRGLGRLHSGPNAGLTRREIVGRFRERVGADATLLCLGLIVALLWRIAPASGLLVLAPLLLLRRALDVPTLERLARTDPKTGLYNARHFSQALQEESRRSARFGRPFTVVMADLDLLRDVNNTYGHLAGDIALRTVANVIRDSLREYDVAARFGGEEFVILLPECEAGHGLVVAERLRATVEATRFDVPSSERSIGITLSLGVASFPAHGATPQDVVHQADLAVYRAKVAGRNRVCASVGEIGVLGVGGETVRWAAPLAASDMASERAEPTAETVAADLVSRARELAPDSSARLDGGPTGASRAAGVGSPRTSDAGRGLRASGIATGAVFAFSLLFAVNGFVPTDEVRAAAQIVIGALGATAILASGAARRAISRLSAEVGRLRRENSELAQSRDEIRAVAHRLARQVGVLLEGRASEAEDDRPSDEARRAWLEAVERAARRQRSDETVRARVTARDPDEPSDPPASYAS